MISNIILTSVVLLHMATFNDLGLTLNTPSNNQQSAQQVGTFNVNQANSNTSPTYGSQGLTLDSGSQAALNTFVNSPKQVGVTTPAPVTNPQPQGTSNSYNDTLARMKNGIQVWNDEILAKLQQDSQGDSKLIDEAYGASSNYLNQAEGALRADYPSILNDITGQYDLGVNQATSGKSATLNTIGEQQVTADQRNNTVMADARRLYDELRRGYQQRFGGASSAGQAASEISAVEQQRQMGKNQQEYGNTVRQIEQARTQVEQKYQDQLANLKQVKDQAVNEANRDFQNKLLQISQSRAENEQAKASARLSALQDLRNKVYQINLQNMQFQQSLDTQKAQTTQGLSDYANTLSGYGQQAQSATGGYNPEVSSSLQVGNPNNTLDLSSSQYQGLISGKKNDELIPGLSF